jgi:hypothetical protein
MHACAAGIPMQTFLTVVPCVYQRRWGVMKDPLYAISNNGRIPLLEDSAKAARHNVENIV